MTYRETIDFLYDTLPMFQRVGPSAFKKDLTNTRILCEKLGNPQMMFKSVHIAGTNGKGSSSHMIASTLQMAGFKVGLYTSPHLKSFTERIKVNGIEIGEEEVVDFVDRTRRLIEAVKPSFFEATVAMAFDYFARQNVDFAVVEVGLGGRLDSTNIIQPEISLITNISYDHKNMLGDTLAQIAGEKAGIIKRATPVVVSERQQEIAPVFIAHAKEMDAPLVFASDEMKAEITERTAEKASFRVSRNGIPAYELESFLTGDYQAFNIPGVIKTLEILSKKYPAIDKDAIMKGIAATKELTGLKGRWQILRKEPLTICDTAHNEGGIAFVVRQLTSYKAKNLRIVFGMVNDKETACILRLLPKDAFYYFCQANIPRALDAEILLKKAANIGLKGEVERNVNAALEKALAVSVPGDVIFIGGSSFVVAELNGL